MSKVPEHSFEVELNWQEGRIGELRSDILNQTIEVATPPEFAGGVEGIWSPEHLYIASISSCFMTTFCAIAEISKLDYEDLRIKAKGLMAPDESGKYIISRITLAADLFIADEKFHHKAQRILEKAESNCLISRSVKTEIELETFIYTGTLKII